MSMGRLGGVPIWLCCKNLDGVEGRSRGAQIASELATEQLWQIDYEQAFEQILAVPFCVFGPAHCVA